MRTEGKNKPNPLDEIYEKVVLGRDANSETDLVKEGATALVKRAASGHPVAAILAETVGPVYVDATIEEIPRYIDDYQRFHLGKPPSATLTPGEYYVNSMNNFFSKNLTKPLSSIVTWMKDLLRRDAERANHILHGGK